MPILVRGLVLALIAVRPLGAGSVPPECASRRILYATAASPGRIDGFRVGAQGALARRPATRVALARRHPRRIVVADGVLYAALSDRVEAFRIGGDGRLSRRPCPAQAGQPCRATTRRARFMEPRDMAVSADGRTLYVVERGRDRLAAYPLDEEGMLAEGQEPTTCVPGGTRGRIPTGYQRLLVDGPLLYVSVDGFSDRRRRGRIDVFQTLPDGSLCPHAAPEPCVPLACTEDATGEDTEPPPSQPYEAATRLRRPRGLVLDRDERMLYVVEHARRRITGFALGSDGYFVVPDGATAPVPVTRTRRTGPYEGFTLHRSLLLGSLFARGRIDSYGLRTPEENRRACDAPPGTRRCLPGRPSRRSAEVIRMSPVGVLAHAFGAPGAEIDVLYVAGGELDRIRAYRLRAGGPRPGIAARPFSETDAQEASFPNDVALAVLPASCALEGAAHRIAGVAGLP